jgi:hypothetical protein
MSHSVPRTWRAWTAFTRSRCATFAILLSFVGISAYAGNIATNTKFTASGFVLHLNGQPFVIKGMDYSPVPGDALPGDAPFGDYFIPDYANAWKPDIDNMRAAGINMIRLYAGNPDLNAGNPGTAGAWKDFLDYCWNGGNNPVYVVMFSFTLGGAIRDGGAGLNTYISQYEKLVKSTVKHPAVFGYVIGNEIFDGVTGNAQFWINFGKLIDAAEAAGLSQGKKPFLTTAITDDFTPQKSWPAIKLGEESGQLKNLDAWSINVYRGPDLGGSGNSPFTQYADLMKQLGLKKPMILGEWGTPHTTRPAPSFYGKNVIEPIANLDDVPANLMGPGQPYYDAVPVGKFLTGLWNTIKGNIAAQNAQVCVGGFIFEWSDEYWKAGNQFRGKQVGGPNPNFLGGAFAGSYGDEAGYGVTGNVDQSAYGLGRPKISRTLFKGYEAVKDFYSASSHTGGELY